MDGKHQDMPGKEGRHIMLVEPVLPPHKTKTPERKEKRPSRLRPYIIGALAAAAMGTGFLATYNHSFKEQFEKAHEPKPAYELEVRGDPDANTLALSLRAETDHSLDAQKIREIFSEYGESLEDHENKNGTYYKNIGDIDWTRGSFTEQGAEEALVTFYDHNQPHVHGWSEMWMLAYDTGWKIYTKLADSGDISFRKVDLEEDGKSEVYVTSRASNQGYVTERGRLIYFGKDGAFVIYENEGFDEKGTGKDFPKSRTHDVEFRDLDGDGISEIIDKEKHETFSLGKDGVEYNTVRKKSETNIYRLFE